MKLDNRGSGLVTVLICVMFLVALGVSLLFVTYTGVAVKVVEQASEKNFYDAESAMELVRLTVQNSVADALGAAWEETLTHYSETIAALPPQGDAKALLQADFTERFKRALKEGGLFTENGAVCDIEALSAPLGSGAAELTGGGVSWMDAQAVAVLKGLTLTYTENGYEDVITTDIAIYAPPFSYEPTPAVTGVSPTAIVAGAGLSVTGERALSGNAYARYISVNGKLSYDKGKLVTDGQVNVNYNATLTGGSDAALWCGGITLGGNSKLLTSGGDIFNYGDLSVNGNSASAALIGTYTGFGFTNELYGENAAANNSSIIVNGRNARLDLQGLDTLILAGSAYISKGGDTTAGSTDVLMGQSIATRSDQLVYLVDEAYLAGVLDSNPCILSPGMTALTDEQLSAVGDALKTALPTYDIDGVQPVYSVLASKDVMVYLFIRFGTREAANSYFLNHYMQNYDYAKLYLAKCAAAKSTIAAGNTYTRAEGANVAAIPASGSGGVLAQCAKLYDSWKNLSLTLTENGTTASADIYSYYVNSAKVDALADGTTLLFKKDGVTLGCVSKGDCTAPACFGPASSSGARILICDGDVTVNAQFTGLIVASGTVTMNASVSSDDQTALALLARCDGTDEALISYLNGGDVALSGTPAAESGGSWDMSALVGYVNWKKS